MDVLAHALWAGIGVAVTSRKFRISRRIAIAAVAAAVLPDLIQLLPLLAWVSSSDAAFATISAYSFADPSSEPTMPGWVAFWSHHLHCTFHSAVIATAVSVIAIAVSRATLIPLAGWWSHIVIDIFTHSADYYAVPVLYPFSMRGFDGIAWNKPWMLALNYAALSLAIGWLVFSRARRDRRNR